MWSHPLVTVVIVYIFVQSSSLLHLQAAEFSEKL